MTPRVARHVLMIEPVAFRPNTETAASNVFQHQVAPGEIAALARAATTQHRALRDLLVENGVQVTVVRSRPETPDASFCNNWFSTHRAGRAGGPTADTLVLYPLLAPNRRIERRPDIVELLRDRYPRVVDLAANEETGSYLESTGSLCLDDAASVAYAALSPRTDRALAERWAAALGYRLVAFEATDETGTPYYHTNVMMFVGHGVTGVCLESIGPGRDQVVASLQSSGLEIVPITRKQVLAFCGNCLPLTNDLGEPLLVMSSAAHAGFAPSQRERLAAHARILHTDLSAFELVGGGSARCLLGELL